MSSPYDLPVVDLTDADLNFLPYRRKVLGVRAIQVHAPFRVRTIDGNLAMAQSGDYLCQDLGGALYPCKREIFEKLYEPVQDPAPAP
jgi:hypothetical protein